MSTKPINEFLQEISRESDRLLTDLMFSQKCVKFLENYRKCLLDFNTKCICDKKFNSVIINSLENRYKTVFKDMTKKSNEKYKKFTINDKKDKNDRSIKDNEMIVRKVDDLEEAVNEETIEVNDESMSDSFDSIIDLSDNEVVWEDNNEYNDKYNEKLKYQKQTNASINPNVISRPSPQFLCHWSECKLKFSDKYSLKSHIESTHKVSQEASVEQVVTNSAVESITENQVYRCDWLGCERVYPNELGLAAHVVHHKQPYKCLECNKRFTAKYTLKVHLNSHSNEKPFKCSKCNKCFTDKTYLRKHTRSQHSGQQFVCNYTDCSYVTHAENNFRRHTLRHIQNNQYICDESGCEKTFLLIESLKYHKKSVHCNERPFPCEWPGCGKRFTAKNSLVKHNLYMHSSERKFKCDISGCNKSFAVISFLNKHKKKHFPSLRPRPLVTCDWPGCEVRCKTNQILSEHKAIHINDPKFMCDFGDCRKSFITNKRLQNHKREHLKLYQCTWPECDVRFGSKRSLTTHMNRHQDLRPHKCESSGCGLSFFSKPLLNHHIKQNHN